MNPNDPNLALLTSVVRALGPLSDRFVFVGGCTTGLLLTDPAAPPIRTTIDVDVIVEVISLSQYHQLERELEQAGFAHDLSPDAPLCRWIVAKSQLDIMPTDPQILGFSNRWHPRAVSTAIQIQLPQGQKIRLITPPLFLATKLEAFKARGQGDFFASHDLEDIVTVVDGRAEIVDEVSASDADLRTYLNRHFSELLNNALFREALPGHLPGDAASQARLSIVEQRLRRLSGQ